MNATVETEFFSNDRVAVVRLNRPKALNALNGELLDQLDDALNRLTSRQNLHAVVLTGSAVCFSAGADLKEELSDTQGRIRRMHHLVERVCNFPLITIAAIEGWALGGGLELAMACTFRVAAPGAKLGLPEIRLGVIPSYGGTQLTPRLVGPNRALEMLCFGARIDAEEASRFGLVNWVADQPGAALAFALERASVLAELAPRALKAARDAVRMGQDLPLGEALGIERSIIAGMLADSGAPDAAATFRSRGASSD